MKAMMYVRFGSVARAIDISKKGNLKKELNEIETELKRNKQVSK